MSAAGLLLLAALASAAPRTLDLTVRLGDFDSKAQLSYPAVGAGPFPLLILVHGTGPADMDASAPGSHIFLDLARAMPERGWAVLRYNKRYVSGPGQADWARFGKTDTHVFVQDLKSVLEKARTLDKVDPKRIVLYGWSEGTAVASAVAAERAPIAGLVLQGPVGLPWRELARNWLDVGTAYLRSHARDGMVTPEVLRLAFGGSGGFVSKVVLPFFAGDKEGAVSPRLDANRDGVLSIDAEIVPKLDSIADYSVSPQGPFAFYGAGAIPSATEQAGQIAVPVLILEGERDASTPVRGAQALHSALKAAGKSSTLKIFPGLGHALSPVSGPVEDKPGSFSPEALRALAEWLESTYPNRNR